MHQKRETVFYLISKHLEVLANYDFRTRHILNFLLGVWICCKIWTLVIYYYYLLSNTKDTVPSILYLKKTFG